MNENGSVTAAVVASLIAASATISCGPRLGPPVAELRASVAEAPLVYAASSSVPVEWKPLRPFDPPGASPSLFVHLLDGSGRLLRTFDRPFPEDWADVEDRIEIWQSALAEPLAAGSYRLTSGIYDAATGRRWRLETNGSEIDEGEYEIAVIEIATSERKTPELVFEGDWHPPEEGQRQNPGRRWLGRGGSIRLLGTGGWSEMALTVSLQELPADRHRPVFEGETSTPQLVVVNGCDSGSETRIDGYGVHAVSLPVKEDGDCALVFETNFTLLDLEKLVYRSVGLESAFFRPD